MEISLIISIIGLLLSITSFSLALITFIQNVYKEWISISAKFSLHFSPKIIYEVDGKFNTIPEGTNGMFLARINIHNNSNTDVGFSNFKISYLDENNTFKKLTHTTPLKVRNHIIMNHPMFHNPNAISMRIDLTDICDGQGTFKANNWSSFNLLSSASKDFKQSSQGAIAIPIENKEVTIMISFETVKPRNLFFLPKSTNHFSKVFKIDLTKDFHFTEDE